MGVPGGRAAGVDQRAAELDRSGHAEALELREDRRQRALHGHFELEQIGDAAAVALDIGERGDHGAVGVGERAAFGHADHSRRRAHS